jgi:2-phospho-L-lactate guanylyltransferase
MLRHVLDAVRRAGLISSCLVVTSSNPVRELAERAGATAVRESSDKGVNAAVVAGLRRTKADVMMVMPSDLPLLSESEIRGALGLKSSGMDLVITPSMDFDGTNLLVLSRDKPLALSFDRDSFWNHLNDASRRGYRVAVYSGRGVRFDVDTVDHLKQLATVRPVSRTVLFARRAVGQ